MTTTDHELEIVRFALALHLDIDPEMISDAQELDRDLGLDPLDLVLIVLRLEELNEIEFPVADLEGIATVGDLAEVVRAWCSDCSDLCWRQERETLPYGSLSAARA